MSSGATDAEADVEAEAASDDDIVDMEMRKRVSAGQPVVGFEVVERGSGCGAR